VISQAAVTRLALLKRGPINADSLGENFVFRKSTDVKKASNGSFQRAATPKVFASERRAKEDSSRRGIACQITWEKVEIVAWV
jgi:hypothetical protein